MEDRDVLEETRTANQTQAARSRWTPKPEQVFILESIFNSGMVNPPKDETVRIRKLLQKFGSVGDANVFYWFQNRRSRSRRRQRQIQAQTHTPTTASASATATATAPVTASACANSYASATSSGSASASSSRGASVNVVDNDGGLVRHHLFSFSSQLGGPHISQNSLSWPSPTPNLHCQSGCMPVFINGLETEVPRGIFDTKAMFGEGTVLVHSSGVPLPLDQFGFLMQSLQQGESYFLLSNM